MLTRQWLFRAFGGCIALADVVGVLCLYGTVRNPFLIGEFIGLLLLVSIAGAFITLFYVKRVTRIGIVGSLIVVYLIGYVVASATGQYYWTQSGLLRYGFGLSVTDRVVWNPRFMWWEPFRDVHGEDTTRGNTLGYLYSPLICLDRRWVHRTEILFDESGEGKLDPRSIWAGSESHDSGSDLRILFSGSNAIRTSYNRDRAVQGVEMSLLSRITINPAICHGKPTIRGLRYPVEFLLELLSSGMSTEEILADYPDLEKDDILAVLTFAAKLSQIKRLEPVAT